MKYITFLILFSFGCASVKPVSPSALESFNNDMAVVTEKADLYYSIGQSYEDNGRVESALENFQKAVEIYPKHKEAWFSIGKILLEKGLSTEGVEKIEKAISVDFKYTEARNFLAYYYFYKEKKLPKSKKLIDISARDLTYRNQEEIWALKLALDRKLADKNTLIKTTKRAISLRPVNCRYRLEIAKSLYSMSLYNQALESARMGDVLCFSPSQKNRLSYLKGLIFIKRNNLLVADKILKNIETKDKRLQNMLSNTLRIVRKKINLGM